MRRGLRGTAARLCRADACTAAGDRQPCGQSADLRQLADEHSQPVHRRIAGSGSGTHRLGGAGAGCPGDGTDRIHRAVSAGGAAAEGDGRVGTAVTAFRVRTLFRSGRGCFIRSSDTGRLSVPTMSGWISRLTRPEISGCWTGLWRRYEGDTTLAGQRDQLHRTRKGQRCLVLADPRALPRAAAQGCAACRTPPGPISPG